MTDDIQIDHAPRSRKPRIALMGEFSAGKSTLANILMREVLSKVQITATQMPPVWYAHGSGAPVRIAMDGTETPIEGEVSGAVSIADTRAVRIYAEADILEACDIIDMPGSSDPNISLDIWEGMLPLADGVIWCTPATQAWRQSEAAMWEDVRPDLQANSLLLLTRIDKILSETDRQRVLRRVRGEVDGMFRAVLPVSLIEAQEAGEDPDLLRASGLESVLEELLQIIADLEPALAGAGGDTADLMQPLNRLAAADPAPRAATRSLSAGLTQADPAPPPAEPAQAAPPETAAAQANAPEAAPEPSATPAPQPAADAARPAVMPRRVVLNREGRTPRPRPRRAEGAGSLI